MRGGIGSIRSERLLGTKSWKDASGASRKKLNREDGERNLIDGQVPLIRIKRAGFSWPKKVALEGKGHSLARGGLKESFYVGEKGKKKRRSTSCLRTNVWENLEQDQEEG